MWIADAINLFTVFSQFLGEQSQSRFRAKIISWSSALGVVLFCSKTSRSVLISRLDHE